ncbi:MAG: ABC transporter substrate-binding protein, partial [Actinobacteria bacterium]|nr:ABC transporter substrate-binding protein [Actinomycetota bacterium]
MRSPRRHRSSLLGCALAAVVLLAACGDDEDDTAATPTTTEAVATTPAPTSEPATTPAAGGTFPVSIEHALGTTVIDAEPARVVTVGVTEQDVELALGVVPVGVTDWYGDQPYATCPWAQDELGDAQPAVLSASDGFEYEQIAALDPDLIIGTNAGMDDTSYALLSEIAPTIAHPKDAAVYFSPWDDQARLIAQALGRTAQMDSIIADIESQFADAAAAHPEFAGTQVVFLQNAFYEGNAIAYQDGLSTEFLTDLGFEVPSELDAFATEGGQAYVPLEQLSVLDAADVLLWATEDPDDRIALESEPLYTGLEEVEDGRLVFT